MSSRQRGIKLQRKNAGGRKSEQHPYHPHPKPSSVQSAVGGAHQEAVSTATNEHAIIDHQPSQQSSSARNEPSSSSSSSSLSSSSSSSSSAYEEFDTLPRGFLTAVLRYGSDLGCGWRETVTLLPTLTCLLLITACQRSDVSPQGPQSTRPLNPQTSDVAEGQLTASPAVSLADIRQPI